MHDRLVKASFRSLHHRGRGGSCRPGPLQPRYQHSTPAVGERQRTAEATPVRRQGRCPPKATATAGSDLGAFDKAHSRRRGTCRQPRRDIPRRIYAGGRALLRMHVLAQHPHAPDIRRRAPLIRCLGREDERKHDRRVKPVDELRGGVVGQRGDLRVPLRSAAASSSFSGRRANSAARASSRSGGPTIAFDQSRKATTRPWRRARFAARTSRCSSDGRDRGDAHARACRNMSSGGGSVRSDTRRCNSPQRRISRCRT